MFTYGELGYAQHAKTMNNEYHALCMVQARTMLPATQCYVTRGGIWNEKESADSFPCKAETERRGKVKPFIYEDIFTLLDCVVKIAIS